MNNTLPQIQAIRVEVSLSRDDWRKLFAGMVVAASYSNSAWETMSMGEIAADSVLQADLLLAELEKKPSQEQQNNA